MSNRDCLSDPDPPKRDWVVETVRDRGAGHFYRYGITGTNLNYPPCHPSRKFMWSVRDLDDERYDMTGARYVGGLNGHASGSLRVDGDDNAPQYPVRIRKGREPIQ